MKFSVDVDEFWLEEEELSEALTAHLKRSIIIEVSKSIEDKVQKAVTEKVTERIKEKLEPLIEATLDDLIEVGTINYNRESVTIVQHIKNLFEKHSGWSNPDKKIEAIAKKFGEELKLQYNSIFATKIVQNMNEQGLIKDSALKTLLDGGNNGKA